MTENLHVRNSRESICGRSSHARSAFAYNLDNYKVERTLPENGTALFQLDNNPATLYVTRFTCGERKPVTTCTSNEKHTHTALVRGFTKNAEHTLSDNTNDRRLNRSSSGRSLLYNREDLLARTVRDDALRRRFGNRNPLQGSICV